MEISFLMLGGNIGDRMNYLSQCIELLRCNVGRIVAMSSVYESEPWGFNDPMWFLNQAVAVETSLTPIILLEKTKEIEKQLGRVRTYRSSGASPSLEYETRTIDIDILFYGNIVINTPELIIPHPLMNERMFVLKPMAEIAPYLVHPVIHHLTMNELMLQCTDVKQVKIFNQNNC